MLRKSVLIMSAVIRIKYIFIEKNYFEKLFFKKTVIKLLSPLGNNALQICSFVKYIDNKNTEA